MHWRSLLCASLSGAAFLASPSRAGAQTPAPTPSPTPPPVSESIVVSATRGAEIETEIPGDVTVITGDELRRKNVTNLADALQDVAGLDTGMGSDNGPRQPNVGLWGLKEFDALLFMVDGVPVGGPFNPSLSQIDIDDIDHIEIVKGPQGTLYGVSAFAGMIQVFTKSATAGTYGQRRRRLLLERPPRRLDRRPDRLRDASGSSATSSGRRAGRTAPTTRTTAADSASTSRLSGGAPLRDRLRHVPEHAVLRIAAARRSAERRGDPGLPDRPQLRADRRAPRPSRVLADGDGHDSHRARRATSRTSSA